MINENFVILGAIIGLMGGISYVISTIKGKTKPNRVTWFLWALAPLIAFAAEIKEGVGIQALMTFMVGFNPLLVFIASFLNKRGAWKLRPFDFICGGLALFGLFLWYITKDGNIAIIFAILADALAAVPTVAKAYLYPETENYHVYLAGMINAGIVLLTVDIWNLAHFAFPVYIFSICLLLLLLIKFKLGKVIQQRLFSK